MANSRDAANKYLAASTELHNHLVNHHWDGEAIKGPDPIGKINWRVTRFVKSYGPWFPWNDRFVYQQGQAYWIRGNLALHELTGLPCFLDVARSCADGVVRRQPPDGAWRHPPIKERRGFISTVEGVWASLGLVKAYRATGTQAYLDAAVRWYEFQATCIGFQEILGGLSANYYAHSKSIVPNVTTMLLWLVAELAQVTADRQYLNYVDGMLRFIVQCQLASGELPYALRTRTHFQCYQYNAFQFVDLANFYELTGNETCHRVLAKLAVYLSSGVSQCGHARYNCFNEVPEVHYWTAALAAALRKAHELGLGDYLALSERAYRHLLRHQGPDGGFGFSERNYVVLHDRRSYPRQQAMILCFLLDRAQ
jgi:DUF1680 family protein